MEHALTIDANFRSTTLLFLLALVSTVFAKTTVEDIFDISADVSKGGCSAAQIAQLDQAFTECMHMVELISEAVGLMSDGVNDNTPELPAVGWMFSYLFAIPGTERRAMMTRNGEVIDVEEIDNNLELVLG